MPEGDTIHRAAATLQAALAGHAIIRFETVFPKLTRVDEDAPLAGRVIENVRPAGKHLLMDFSGGLTLRTHMQMNGSWHLYRPGERWQKRRADMRIVIETSDWVAVAFNVTIAEFITDTARHSALRRLGPDLTAVGSDLEEACRRVSARSGEEIANVLLNQSVVAGIGNVYKSEVLFLTNVNPFRRVDSLTGAEVEAIIETAARLLRHNATRIGGGRETRVGGSAEQRLWVYGRAGKPCRRCEAPIRMVRQGGEARVTFWCDRCQPPGRVIS